MVMDMYELTMSNGYLNKEFQDTIAVFDVFYRSNPDQAGFAVFAGLEQVVEYDLIPILEEYWFDNPRKLKEWEEKLKEAVQE